jgi:ADP-ribose pyrophosphatase YjhB (NUDIX family)
MTLPGGWADVGESPSEAVIREVLEESGYQVQAVRLLAVYDREKHAHPPLAQYVYKLFFECEIVGGAAASSVETEDVAFFAREALPALSLTRVVPAQIDRFFDLHDQQMSPTDFD